MQVAHQTIYKFIVDEKSIPLLRDFNVNLQSADHHAGEICLTYLNFNKF